MIDRIAVARHFSRAATSYDAAAVLQREVAARLAERFPLFKLQPACICDLGAGTGFLSVHLRQHYPGARLLSVDLSETMLQQCQAKLASARRWWHKLIPWAKSSNHQVVTADAYQLPFADASVDMMVSSLMLQWCDDLDAVLAECRRVLKPDGILMIATLGPDTLQELRRAWQVVDGQADLHMLHFVDLHDLGDALGRAGFANPVCDAEHITLTYHHAIEAIKDLKQIGATNANRARHAGLMGKARWQRFLAAYQAQATADGRVPTTFEVVYAHGWVAQQRPLSASNPIASVSIDQIRRWQPKDEPLV